MALADDLRTARALIADRKNWGKGDYLVCAAGACVRASAPRVTRHVAWPITYAEKALQDHLPAGFVSVPHFNDFPTTTHADVLALFDRAINAAEDPTMTTNGQAVAALLDPRDDPEKPLHHPVLAALDAQPEPLLYLDQTISSEDWEAAMQRWHGEALAQLIVEGHVIDHAPDFLAQGHMARYAYTEPGREAAHQELILRNGG